MQHRLQASLAGLLLASTVAVGGLGWWVVVREGAATLATVPGVSFAGVVAAPPGRFAVSIEVPDALPLVAPVPEVATATWTLHGSVRDDLGRGLAGALIDAGDFRTLSDGRGDFQLGGLRRLGESVQLDVIVSAAGHTREHRTFHDASRAAASRAQFELERHGSLRGLVRDSAGRAVSGTRVLLTDSDDPREQFTDAQGGFRFLDVPSGFPKVSVEVNGFIGARASTSVQPGAWAESDTLVVRARGRITGRALDRLGGPIAGAIVRFEWAEVARDGGPPEDGFESKCRPIVVVPRTRLSEADGSFRGDGLAPGVWRVAVFPPDGVQGAAPGVAQRILAEGDEIEVDVSLTEPEIVHGVVLDRFGWPASGCNVTARLQSLLTRGEPSSVVTDVYGRFEFTVAPDACVALSAGMRGESLVGHASSSPDARTEMTIQLRGPSGGVMCRFGRAWPEIITGSPSP